MTDIRTAIITGASHGIGAAVSERLAKDGLAVIVNYAGSPAEAEALASRIKAAGGQAMPVKADVSDPKAVAHIFDVAQSSFGGVDVLVNNAGIMQLAAIADADDAFFDRHVAVNLKGVFNGLREGAKRLRPGGRIISFSSSVVGLYQPNYAVYAATKAGVEAMTHVLSKELRGRNITVNAIAPGPTATELFLKGKPQDGHRRIRQACSPGAAGPSRRHRQRRGFPCRTGRRLDQWPGAARQRRNHLNSPNSRSQTEMAQQRRKRTMKKVIIVTGASSGFGRLSANALARAGHTVYASMRETQGRNAPQVADVEKYAKDNNVDLRAIELDVGSQASADAGIAQIIAANGRIDVIMHNAGHMVFGPAEAFTPEQLAQLYDINVLGTQRVNRAALPQLRKQREGLLVWVSSSSSAGGTPPYLSPYFAAKAGMDALAVQYARELTRWGIETSIIVPGAFTGGTNHFAHAGHPADIMRVAEYEAGPTQGLGRKS